MFFYKLKFIKEERKRRTLNEKRGNGLRHWRYIGEKMGYKERREIGRLFPWDDFRLKYIIQYEYLP